LGGVGAVLPVTLGLTHVGETLSQVRGPIYLDEGLGGNLTGNVTGDGRLVLGGSFTFLETESGVTFRFEFGGWDTRLIAPDQMRGRWAQNLSAFGVPGNAYMENELVTMTKTSPTPTTSAVPSHYSLTWQELFKRIR
jgi:hypothetical protein